MTPGTLPVLPVSPREALQLFCSLTAYKILILAVSGGVDSFALLHLAADARALGAFSATAIFVATVDHGLRPGSAGEADVVAKAAAKLGFAHRTLTWSGVKPSTGVMDAARAARYRLLAEFASEAGGGQPAAIVTGHHRDDQVETFLMRLARGSGLDGLAGMSVTRQLDAARSIDIVRPLLSVAKARLIATLETRGERWVDDPSNERVEFERVRLRQAESALGMLGLTAEAIALAAQRLGSARAALDATCLSLEHDVVLHSRRGIYTDIDRTAFNAAPSELRVRLLRRFLDRHGGASSPAQLSEVEALAGRLGQTLSMASTLGGVMVSAGSRRIRVYREPGRIVDTSPLRPGEAVIWDKRFVIAAQHDVGFVADVRPLGFDGLQQMRRDGVAVPAFPARALQALPAIWRENVLIACPVIKTLSEPGDEAESGPNALSELFTADVIDTENA